MANVDQQVLMTAITGAVTIVSIFARSYADNQAAKRRMEELHLQISAHNDAVNVRLDNIPVIEKEVNCT